MENQTATVPSNSNTTALVEPAATAAATTTATTTAAPIYTKAVKRSANASETVVETPETPDTESVSKDDSATTAAEADKKDEPKKDSDKESEKPETERFAALVKAEKKLQLEKTHFKEESAKMKAEIEALRTTHKQEIEASAAVQKEIGELKGNAEGVLDFIEKYLDLDIVKLAAYYNDSKSPDFKIKQLERKLQADKASEAESIKKTQEAANAKAAEEWTKNYKSQISTFISGNNESYELIVDEFGDTAADNIYAVMEEHFNKTLKDTGTGAVLKIDDAAKMLEDYLEERYQKKLQTKKLSKYVKPNEASNKTPSSEEGSKEAITANIVSPTQPIYSTGLRKRSNNSSGVNRRSF